MIRRNAQFATGLTAAILIASFAAAAVTFAQDVPSGIVVTRTPYLSLTSVPISINFGQYEPSGAGTNLFSNTNGDLPGDTNLIAVRDTRNSGGFVIQAQASDFTTTGTETFDAENLRVATSGLVAAGTVPAYELLQDNIFYLDGYLGTPSDGATQNITTSVAALNSNFGLVATFDEIEARPMDNSLDTPVSIMSACLPATSGRVGTVATGMAFNLTIPQYTASGDYFATITYTLMDYTEDPCP